MSKLLDEMSSVQSSMEEGSEDGRETARVSVPARAWNLLLVDRRDLIRGCLTLWLNASTRVFKVFGADVVDAILGDAGLTGLDVIVLSIEASPCARAWLERQVGALRRAEAKVPVVVIGDEDWRHLSEDVLRCGLLRGYIPSWTNMDIALAALNLVATGGCYLPPSDGGGRYWGPRNGTSAPQSRDDSHQLTPREMAVLTLLQRGLPNKNIAFDLSMSESTVKVHVRNITKKLGARNRTEAVALAHSLWPTLGGGAGGSHLAPRPASTAACSREEEPRNGGPGSVLENAHSTMPQSLNGLLRTQEMPAVKGERPSSAARAAHGRVPAERGA